MLGSVTRPAVPLRTGYRRRIGAAIDQLVGRRVRPARMGLVRPWSRIGDLPLSQEEKLESVDVIGEVVCSAVVGVTGVPASVHEIVVLTQEQEAEMKDGVVEVHLTTLIAVSAPQRYETR